MAPVNTAAFHPCLDILLIQFTTEYQDCNELIY